MRLKLGQSLVPIEDYGIKSHWGQGVVVYIHPRKRFYTVEFTFPCGSFRECFPIHPLKEKVSGTSRIMSVSRTHYRARKIPD